MTRLEQPPVAQPPPAVSVRAAKPKTQPRAAVPQPHRFLRFLARHATIHLVLVSCAVMFPFAWMVGTSLKTDEEAVESSWFPALPTFREVSPYIRSTPAIEAPTGVVKKDFDAGLPLITEITRAALARAELPSGAEAVDAN